MFSRRALYWLILATALAGALAKADDIASDGALPIFSLNYEGRLESVAKEDQVLEVFKVRGYQIFYIEFEDASVQSRSLDRIGIFVESDEHYGKILAPQLMKTLEAEALFDGHDYSVEDVANFYTKVARLAIKLDPREERLRVLLIRLEVMAEQDGRYVATKRAALLSAVAGMDERHGAGTRRWVLDHEFRHGFYFVTLKAGVHRIWEEMLSSREREMIAAALAMTARYNRADSSLMAREFHAMVFEDRFEDDLKRLAAPWFTGTARAEDAEVKALVEKIPEIRRAFQSLESRLLQRPS